MTELTLLSKIYNSHQMKQITTILENLFGDLDVTFSVKGTLAGRWIQLELSGEDETVAAKMLERETGGFCPVGLGNVKKFSALKGYVMNLEKSSAELSLDVGVVEPNLVPAVISLSHLQKHLANGEKMSLKKISEMWGICENLPLEIKVLDIHAKENRIEAELQPTQIRKYAQWRDSLLDRLIVVGASLNEVNNTVAGTGLNRDIIDVETLGLFEHALVCKLGTDAAGLVGRLGRRLWKARFTVFNPKHVLSFSENPQIM
jgi:hypothetical protein